MDLQMPGVSGIEATRRLTQELPDVKVLMLTMVDDDQAVYAAVQAGALGYLLKGAGKAEIARALASAAAGQGVYSPAVARRLRSFFNGGSPAATPFPMLSDRERDVLRLIAAGKSNADIARSLVIAVSTVKSHTNRIFGKLGVTSRTAAIVRARELELL